MRYLPLSLFFRQRVCVSNVCLQRTTWLINDFYEPYYRYIIAGITKSEAIDLLRNIDFSGKSESW